MPATRLGLTDAAQLAERFGRGAAAKFEGLVAEESLMFLYDGVSREPDLAALQVKRHPAGDSDTTSGGAEDVGVRVNDGLGVE
jgi:hypothetical protein